MTECSVSGVSGRTNSPQRKGFKPGSETPWANSVPRRHPSRTDVQKRARGGGGGCASEPLTLLSAQLPPLESCRLCVPVSVLSVPMTVRGETLGTPHDRIVGRGGWCGKITLSDYRSVRNSCGQIPSSDVTVMVSRSGKIPVHDVRVMTTRRGKILPYDVRVLTTRRGQSPPTDVRVMRWRGHTSPPGVRVTQLRETPCPRASDVCRAEGVLGVEVDHVVMGGPAGYLKSCGLPQTSAAVFLGVQQGGVHGEGLAVSGEDGMRGEYLITDKLRILCYRRERWILDNRQT